MRASLSIILVFSFFALIGQQQIMTTVSISKDTLYIGEELVLDIKIDAPYTAKIKYIDISAFDSIQTQAKTSDIPDSLLLETYAEIEWPGDAEFANGLIPVSQFVKEGSSLTKSMSIRFWDIGVFRFPAPKVVQDSGVFKINRVVSLETPVLFVLPPKGVAPADTTQILMPIKPILSEGKTWEDFVWLGYLLAFLLTLALVFYMIVRGRRKTEFIEEEEEIIIRPAHIVSLEKLESLKTKELWQQGKIKEYQSELTYIIREYLENRFGVQALESTTDEIVKDLKGGEFNPQHEESLKEILQIADLVKFAKAKPTEDIHDRFMNQAVDFVEETKKLIETLEQEDGLV